MIVRKLREDELKRGAELSALAFEYALRARSCRRRRLPAD